MLYTCIFILLQVVKKFLLYTLLVLNANFAWAQLHVVTVNDTLTPDQIVRSYFLGSGISIKKVSYKGEADALGLFTDKKAITGFSEGLIISNGRADLLPGKNSRPNAGANFGKYFFFDQDFITNANMCDGAVLEFDFVPSFDSIVFRFVFGSEEYPEFVGKNFNDAFALLIKPKAGRNAYKNIGTLPNGNTVMINNVNSKRNREWFVANDKFEDPLYNELEYDGITKPIVATARVIPYQIYHLKIMIADLGDCEYDSGVLLEAHSFNSFSTHKSKLYRKNYYFNFNHNRFDLSETDKKKVKQLTDSLARFSFDSIVIIGHTDSIGIEEENVTLSKNRAESIAYYFMRAAVKTNNIHTIGAGSSKPIQPNTSEKGRAANRRVEILFYHKKQR